MKTLHTRMLARRNSTPRLANRDEQSENEVHDRVLKKRNEILGGDHLDTLASMDQLAGAYWAHVRNKEATKVCEEVRVHSDHTSPRYLSV